MARQVPSDAVIEALGHVKYPGFAADIVALGLVEDAQPAPNGGFASQMTGISARKIIPIKLNTSLTPRVDDWLEMT